MAQMAWLTKAELRHWGRAPTTHPRLARLGSAPLSAASVSYALRSWIYDPLVNSESHYSSLCAQPDVLLEQIPTPAVWLIPDPYIKAVALRDLIRVQLKAFWTSLIDKRPIKDPHGADQDLTPPPPAARSGGPM